jgi:hypothetical protein
VPESESGTPKDKERDLLNKIFDIKMKQLKGKKLMTFSQQEKMHKVQFRNMEGTCFFFSLTPELLFSTRDRF